MLQPAINQSQLNIFSGIAEKNFAQKRFKAL